MIDEIADLIRGRRLMLFVGSGVSSGLGLPRWQELIDHLALQLGFDPQLFKGYGGFLELAEFYRLQVGSLGALRSWMDRNWHKDESIVDSSEVHQCIIKLDFPVIYTTNFDKWLEIAHARHGKPYVRIANIGDFAKVIPGHTPIVKLHGDFEDDSSIVFTESSYFERLMFDSPIDLRFRADSIGTGILFVGYSLSDINVRYLLYKLHTLWSSSVHEAVRPKSFMFLTRPNPIQEAILRARGIVPIVSKLDDSRVSAAEFLKDLVARI